MTRTNSRKSTSKKAFYLIILTLIALIGVLGYLSTKKHSIQEMSVYKANIDKNIGGLIVMAKNGYINMPNGIHKAVKKAGKDKIVYGTILRGSCTTYFTETGTTDYLKAHPKDIVWKTHAGQGEVTLWIFLEKGTIPDIKFLQLTED